MDYESESGYEAADDFGASRKFADVSASQFAPFARNTGGTSFWRASVTEARQAHNLQGVVQFHGSATFSPHSDKRSVSSAMIEACRRGGCAELFNRYADDKKRCSSGEPEREANAITRTPSATALTPTVHGCKNIGELNDAGSVIFYPKPKGLGSNGEWRGQSSRVNCTQATNSQPEPRERLAVRGRTPIRKTACVTIEDNRQVPSPINLWPNVRRETGFHFALGHQSK